MEEDKCRGQPQIADHGVDVVLQLGHLAAHARQRVRPASAGMSWAGLSGAAPGHACQIGSHEWRHLARSPPLNTLQQAMPATAPRLWLGF
mgnify:CR=1 FL=1